MKRMLALARKELLQLRRDPMSMKMIVMVPLMQLIIFGYAINYDVKNLKTVVLDESRSFESRELVAKMQAKDVDVLYYAGYPPEAGLLIRQLRDRGDDVQLVAADGLTSEDFWLIAGTAGEGAMFTSFRDPSSDPAAVTIIERARAHGMLGPIIEGERIRLEPPRAEFLPTYIRWFTDMTVTRYLLHRNPPTP